MRLTLTCLALLTAVWTAGCSGSPVGTGDARSEGGRADVIVDVTTPIDEGIDDVSVDDAADASTDDTPADDSGRPVIGPTGGRVDRLHFAVFGDVRPSLPDVSSYPSAIITRVMDGIEAEGAQFAVSSGDYMNENVCRSCANSQIDQLLAAERHFNGHIFHGMGNHECFTITTVNCPNENEYSNVQVYRARLIPEYSHTYFDFWIDTSMGRAHFISVAPNAWSTTQETWLRGVVDMPARYTFVMAHEPPTTDSGEKGPGTDRIETIVNARTGGVTVHLWGHVHNYQHNTVNGVIVGNAGAPVSRNDFYGFAMVDQLDDGNIRVTAYEVGDPPLVRDTFTVRPDGTSPP